MRIYHIPPNFAQEGMIMGRFKTRNFIEAACLAAVAVGINAAIPVAIKGHIYIAVFTILPAALFGIMGIHGMSLTEFLFTFFKYLRTRDIYKEPNSRERIARQRRIMKEQAKDAKKRRKAEMQRQRTKKTMKKR